MTTAQTLTSLAMLKVDLDQQHRNYVDYVSPFVIDILNVDKPEIISDGTIADKLLVKFGLNVPTKAVQHLLRRLLRQGYLANEDGLFVVKNLPHSTLSHTREVAKSHIESVISGLIAEAKSHQLEWSNDEATVAITAFLSKFTVDCLRTYVFNTALPFVPHTKSTQLYVVSKFVTQARARGDSAFESFIVLVKGLMYSNALLCPDLESLEKKFQDLTFYLDTPLLLNLLGLQGKDAKRSADELVNLLQKLKGSLAVFSHTISETQQVLSAAASNYYNQRANGKVIEEVRRNGTQLSEIILVRDSVDERINKMGIATKRTPEYMADYQIDELEFDAALTDEVYYKGESAKLNDINSIRAIYTLRKGRQPVRLEDALAVFVTTNQGFAKAAFHAGREHNSTREVSTVITAYSLANIAWLKSPIDAPSLPLNETLALCYAALEPSHDLFRKYVQEMDKLLESGQISVRDHEILRLSPSARDELMDLTLGDENAFTINSIKNILANAKAAILSEQKQTHDMEIDVLSKQGAEQLSVFQQRELALADRVVIAEKAATQAAKEAQDAKIFAELQKDIRYKQYRKIARGITNAIIACALVFLLIGALAGSGLISVGSDASSFTKCAIAVAIFLVVSWGVYSWYNGTTVKQLATFLENKLVNHLASWLESNN